MSAELGFDRLLTSVLEENGPRSAPEAMVAAALARARSTGQRRLIVRALDRRAWPAGRLGSVIWSRRARVLVLALIAAALVALGLAGIGALRPPMVIAIDDTFIKPYEYSIPADSSIRRSVRPTHLREMVAWVNGPDLTPDQLPATATLGGGQPDEWEARGIIVGYGEEAWSHADEANGGGRFMLRTSPAQFLVDLRDVAGTSMGVVSETTLDGRPALTTMLPGIGGTDIHVTGRMGGIGGNFALVTMPSRLIVTDVDGTSVFVLIWARTADDLAAWMPTADTFVRSIHFLPEGQH